MGRGKQEQPLLIAQKLRQIRRGLGLTQDEMANRLKGEGVMVHRGYIGSFEIGERVPSLLITMAYAKLANISMEEICNDELQLPEHLQCQAKRL